MADLPLGSVLPRVVYIMGTARSGSTLLEIMLSGGKGVFSAGEMTSLPSDGFLNEKDCSCGENFRNCVIWRDIAQSLKMTKNGYLLWSKVQRSIDWHDGFVRQMLFLSSKKTQQQYSQYNRSLLHAISVVTGASIVADSSKYAGRALALRRITDVDLSVICLIRSPRSLMASFQKPNVVEQRPKRPFAAFTYYVLALLSLRATLGVLKERAVVVRYEDLVAQPVAVLEKIEAKFSLDLAEVKDRLQRDEPLPVGHLVTANRVRKEKQIRVRDRDAELSPVGIGANLSVALMRFWQWLLRF